MRCIGHKGVLGGRGGTGDGTEGTVNGVVVLLARDLGVGQHIHQPGHQQVHVRHNALVLHLLHKLVDGIAATVPHLPGGVHQQVQGNRHHHLMVIHDVRHQVAAHLTEVVCSVSPDQVVWILDSCHHHGQQIVDVLAHHLSTALTEDGYYHVGTRAPGRVRSRRRLPHILHGFWEDVLRGQVESHHVQRLRGKLLGRQLLCVLPVLGHRLRGHVAQRGHDMRAKVVLHKLLGFALRQLRQDLQCSLACRQLVGRVGSHLEAEGHQCGDLRLQNRHGGLHEVREYLKDTEHHVVLAVCQAVLGNVSHRLQQLPEACRLLLTFDELG
mmetsp:Transcript_1917/g.5611  ORF Transcript_1917/g.5611 Transcript_1917/m.5611 type:complete len:325 (+) Transcript_1917:1047-2021(+)